MRTGGHGERREAEKADAENTVAPSGHDDARQALSELRRIVDAERHRIRRELIGVRHKIRRDENRGGQPNRLRRERCEDLVANALTTIAVTGRLILRRSLPIFNLPLLLTRAAVVKKIETVSRQHEQGDDGDE